MLLKKTHELLALNAVLRPEGRRTRVIVELESHAGGTPTVLWQRHVSVDELGLPRYLQAREFPSFHMPAHVTDDVAARVAALQLPPSHPLWLHLIKPYGYLGIVPWEALLLPAVGRPVLRLPDFLERPRENRSVLDVAICCSAPLSELAFSVPDLLGAMADVILRESPRPRTGVHIFGDVDTYEALRTRFAGEPRVSVHDPEGAGAYGEQERSRGVAESARAVRCPWLLWIRDAMRGRSLDTVHFVCHGYLADDRPALALAESPLRNRDRRTARFVGVAELATFLTQTGAWSAAFTSPPNNYSEAGSRLLADTLAQARPGPVLFHDPTVDATLGALGAAYRFLFAPSATQPPAEVSCFMYCQPALVESQGPVAAPSVVPAVFTNTELFSAAAGDEPRMATGGTGSSGERPEGAVPNWLAAAQRYVEGAALDLQRRESGEPPTASGKGRATDVAAKTLEDLQNVVASFARRARTDPTP